MLPLRVLLLVLITSLSLVADAQGRRRAVRIPETALDIYQLSGYEPTLPTSDLAPFLALVGDADVVGLGEPWHTSGGFYMLKHRLFRYLVQTKGFRAFAMESNWETVERTNSYVQTCVGKPEDAIRDEHIVWHSKEYADMVRWMCEWNRSHPKAADRLTIFGVDIQQPELDGPALALFMSQLGMPAADPRLQGLRSCEKAFGLTHPFGEIPPAVHATCLDAIAGIESYLDENRTDVIARTSQQAFDIAVLRVIGLRANQEEVMYIRDDFAKGFNYRDEAMAYAFHVRRAMLAPGAKTVVWGDNVHVAQNLLPNGERPMGSHLEAALGDEYVSFGLTAFQTETPVAPGVCGLAPRHPGSAEERLAKYGHQALLAVPRGTPSYEAMPMGYFTYRPFADFDGIFFLAHSPSMRPLYWAHCR